MPSTAVAAAYLYTATSAAFATGPLDSQTPTVRCLIPSCIYSRYSNRPRARETRYIPGQLKLVYLQCSGPLLFFCHFFPACTSIVVHRFIGCYVTTDSLASKIIMIQALMMMCRECSSLNPYMLFKTVVRCTYF